MLIFWLAGGLRSSSTYATALAGTNVSGCVPPPDRAPYAAKPPPARASTATPAAPTTAIRPQRLGAGAGLPRTSAVGEMTYAGYASSGAGVIDSSLMWGGIGSAKARREPE